MAAYESTAPAADDPNETVLLPGEKRDPRYVLGPAQLAGKPVKRAVATLTPTEGWIVTITFTPAGAKAWNAMAARYFHQVIGFDLDGVVETAPITLPNSPTFVSFGDAVEVSGAFDAVSAKWLAAVLDSGALRVPLAKT